MLDFFKDTYLEMSGVDTQKLKKEREEKKKKEKEERYIFSKKIRILTIILGIIYLLIAGSEIVILARYSCSIMLILKILFQVLIDIVVIVCLVLKKKEYEKIALALIVLFFVVGYMSVLII